MADPKDDQTYNNQLRSLISSSSSENSDNDDYTSPHSNNTSAQSSSWWFMEPAVRRNKYIIILILLFLLAGIACFITGIILEILYHTIFDNILRGFVFMIIAIIILIPACYAIVHVYLAAKRVGRIRFSSVWFFRY